MEKIIKIITIILIILGFISLFRTIILIWNNYLPDFSVFYNAAVSLHQNKNPYTDPILFAPLNYVPITLTFFYPLLIFSYTTASKVWIIISLICLFLSIFVLYKMKPILNLLSATLFFLVVISFPFKYTLGMGQTNLILLLLICIFLYYLNLNREIGTGISLAISTVLKIFPGFILLYFIIKKKITVLLAFVITLTIIALFSIILVSKENNIHFFEKVLPSLIVTDFGGWYYNQSIIAVFHRLNINIIYTLISRILLLIISLVVSYKTNKRLLSVSLLLISVLLTNSFTWQHHLILLIIPYYVLLTCKPTKMTSIFIIISYILVSYNIKYPQYYMDKWYGGIILSHGFMGMFILWFVVLFTIYANRQKTRI